MVQLHLSMVIEVVSSIIQTDVLNTKSKTLTLKSFSKMRRSYSKMLHSLFVSNPYTFL